MTKKHVKKPSMQNNKQLSKIQHSIYSLLVILSQYDLKYLYKFKIMPVLIRLNEITFTTGLRHKEGFHML